MVKLLTLESSLSSVVGSIMAPKDAHVLSTGTCEYGALCGKRDFKGTIQ